MLIKSIVIGFGFLCFSLWEKHKPFAQHTHSSLWTNLSLGAISMSISSLIIMSLQYFYWPHTNNSLGFVSVLKAVLLLDLASYFWHMLSHKIPTLWLLHQVHHTEVHMEASTAFRFHFLEVVLSLVPRYLFVYYFELPIESVLIFEILFQWSNIHQHSNIYWPKKIDHALQFFFVTPAMHRHHHSIDSKHQHSNYSTVFSIWDKMMNSYTANTNDNPTPLGLKNFPPPNTTKLQSLLKHPFQKM